MKLLAFLILATFAAGLFSAAHGGGKPPRAADQDRVRAAPEAVGQDSPPARPHPTPTAASRSRRSLVIGRRTEPHGPFWKWVASAHARRVANCESGGDPRAVSHTGKYRGKWQMDADFWATYGGLKYASRPDLASEEEQDRVAYAGWLARGWQPWECR